MDRYGYGPGTRRFWLLVPAGCIWLVAAAQGVVGAQWSDVHVRLLPDASFALVERAGDGTILRHCPYRDHNGNIDHEQLILVLGTLQREDWADPASEEKARRHLEAHYNRFHKKAVEKGFEGKIDINEAPLTTLVLLPNIGPVLAVQIVEYREKVSRFGTIEDVRKVEGIGQGTFNAIRHYIRTQ